MSSAHEKWGQKQKCCVYNFVQCIYICNGDKQVDAVQVNLTSPDLKDALATNASGCSHLASLLARPSPMQEISGSSPASEQLSETRYI